MIGLAVAENVSEGQNTMSSFSTPANLRAKCIAALPDAKAAACPIPTLVASSCSKPLTFGPSGAIQLVSNACFTYSCS